MECANGEAANTIRPGSWTRSAPLHVHRPHEDGTTGRTSAIPLRTARLLVGGETLHGPRRMRRRLPTSAGDERRVGAVTPSTATRRAHIAPPRGPAHRRGVAPLQPRRHVPQRHRRKGCRHARRLPRRRFDLPRRATHRGGVARWQRQAMRRRPLPTRRPRHPTPRRRRRPDRMTDRAHRPRRMATRVRTPPRTGATNERPNGRQGLHPGHAPHGSLPRRLAPMRAPPAQPALLAPRLLRARVSPHLPSRPRPPRTRATVRPGQSPHHRGCPGVCAHTVSPSQGFTAPATPQCLRNAWHRIARADRCRDTPPLLRSAPAGLAQPP